MLLEHLTIDPAGSSGASTSRARTSSRPRERRSSSGSCAATAQSSSTSSSSTRRTTSPRCDRVTSSCSRDATKVEPADDRLPRRHRRRLLRLAVPARVGASRRSCAPTCARRFGNAWFTHRDAGSLLRELWAEGQKPTADELLREVTGETLELAAVGRPNPRVARGRLRMLPLTRQRPDAERSPSSRSG